VIVHCVVTSLKEKSYTKRIKTKFGDFYKAYTGLKEKKSYTKRIKNKFGDFYKTYHALQAALGAESRVFPL
jgi:uncharacterized protein YktA (UPF0223 family)